MAAGGRGGEGGTSSSSTADGRPRGGYGVLLGLVPLVVPAEAIGMTASIVLQGLTVVVATDAVSLSDVTMATVGFGDVTPVGGLARAVTVLEAILGQLYLVSVVALIVGNVGRMRPAVQQGLRSEEV